MHCGRLASWVILGFAAACLIFLAGKVNPARSLWLDEAWVANSTIAPMLHEVFFYPRWLQTSPPLFLLLIRATVRVLGPSNATFRAVPLAMLVLSAILMWRLVSKALLRPYAILAWTMFVASPVAFEYALSLKQYSSDVTASAALLLSCWSYLRRPTRGRFLLLCGVLGVGLLLSYSLVFALPFVALLLLARRAYLRASAAALIGGSIFSWEYTALIAKNASPVLKAFWAPDYLHSVVRGGLDLLWLLPLPDRLLLHANLAGSAAGALALAGFLLSCRRRGKWLELQVLCAGPCALVCVANYFSFYPMTARTELFLLPFLVVLFFSDFQLLITYVQTNARTRLSIRAILIAASILTLAVGARKIEAYSRTLPEEDTASAVTFLRDHVRPGDILWVHASASEPFRLYAHVLNWADPGVVYGNTGWPCCPRGVLALRNTGSARLVRNDFNRTVAPDWNGKIWLLYTTRAAHWEFVGLDESKVIQAMLSERGCREAPMPGLRGIGVSAWNCGKAHFLSDLSTIRNGPVTQRW
jgi:hypothetical protein